MPMLFFEMRTFGCTCRKTCARDMSGTASCSISCQVCLHIYKRGWRFCNSDLATKRRNLASGLPNRRLPSGFALRFAGFGELCSFVAFSEHSAASFLFTFRNAYVTLPSKSRIVTTYAGLLARLGLPQGLIRDGSIHLRWLRYGSETFKTHNAMLWKSNASARAFSAGNQGKAGLHLPQHPRDVRVERRGVLRLAAGPRQGLGTRLHHRRSTLEAHAVQVTGQKPCRRRPVRPATLTLPPRELNSCAPLTARKARAKR